MKKPVHVSFSGQPGSGKSTISSYVASKYIALWNPRETCRDRRKGEVKGREYNHHSCEYMRMLQAKQLFIPYTIHPVPVGKEIHLTGVLVPRLWPQPTPETELIISTYGSAAPEIKKRDAPNLVTIFIAVPDEEDLKERLVTRNTRKDILKDHLETYTRYKNSGIEKKFDYVVYNKRDRVLECVEEIERILGLPSFRNPMLTP